MRKDVAVLVPGTGDEREICDLSIQPGTTAAEVLKAMELDPAKFQLQLQREGRFQSLSGSDNIYGAVETGEKLFCVPKDMTVG
jgi:hypothetical protein